MLASRLSVLTSGISSFRASANLGRTSALSSWPCCISFSSSPMLTPAALAMACRATGSCSPICWRNSSELTLPLLIICERAVKT